MKNLLIRNSAHTPNMREKLYLSGISLLIVISLMIIGVNRPQLHWFWAIVIMAVLGLWAVILIGRLHQPKVPPRHPPQTAEQTTESSSIAEEQTEMINPKEMIPDGDITEPIQMPYMSRDGINEAELQRIFRTNTDNTSLLEQILHELRLSNQQNLPEPEIEFEIDPSLTPDFDSLPGWIKKNIRSKNEKVVAITRLNWVRAVPSVSSMVLVTIGLWTPYIYFLPSGGLIFSLVFFSWLVAMIVAVVAFLKFIRYAYIWTDTRIIRYRGILNIQTATIPYNQVTDFTCDRPFFGRILGYWHVHIETPGQDQRVQEEWFLKGDEAHVIYVDTLVNAKSNM